MKIGTHGTHGTHENTKHIKGRRNSSTVTGRSSMAVFTLGKGKCEKRVDFYSFLCYFN